MFYAPGSIVYLVVLPPLDPGETSYPTPFQGFSDRILSYAQTIEALTRFPTNVFEVFATRERAMRGRAIGIAPYEIVFLELDLLARRVPLIPFPCVVSGEATLPAAERALNEIDYPVLHITTAACETTALRIADIGRADFHAWVRRIFEAYRRHRADDLIEPLRRLDRDYEEWPRERLDLRAIAHNLTLPNELLLRSFNFELAPGEPLPAVIAEPPDNLDDRFAEVIESSAAEVFRQRAPITDAVAPGTPGLILTVAGVFGTLRPRTFHETDAPPVVRRSLRTAYRAIVRQEHYVQIAGPAEQVAEAMGQPPGAVAIEIRRRELACHTAVLSARAAGHFTPVVRLPPSANLTRAKLIDLAGAVRGRGQRRAQTMSRIASEVGELLLRSVPERLTGLISRPHTGVKLISDAPLELLPIDGVPLALRHATSRLPITPGDMFARHGLASGTVVLEPEDLRRILIVRSFAAGDRLRPLLERAVREYLRDEAGDFPVDVVDVDSVDALIRALDGHRPAVVIFDGHGFHPRDEVEGGLRIGREVVHPFDLEGRLNVPPIVILCACDTHPMDGTHASVANALLYMGAKTVLGTLAPISGISAALLVGRLYLRLVSFIPHFHRPVNWAFVMHGLQRMMYVTDVLRVLAVREQTAALATREVHLRIHTAANVDINTGHDDWFENFLVRIADETGAALEDVEALWRRYAYFTETMLYVQLGDPEHVWIGQPDAEQHD